MVEVEGQLVRACATEVFAGMRVVSESQRADGAQREAMDRILQNHDLYCTVCDNNNKNCTVHNAVGEMDVKHQARPYQHKPYPQDHSNPFYRYDPDQCILCGRCVEACQDVQVNETLTIDWTSRHPRVLWDGGEQIAGSSCVSCGHCVTVCPCNALMEKSMLGQAGYLTNLPGKVLDDMIEVIKGVEPELGYPPILALSDMESEMREARVKRTKTVCTYCGVGCSFDVWTQDRHILKIEPEHGAANGISTCVKGKFGYDFVNSPTRLHTPLIRKTVPGKGETYVEATWDEALTLITSKFTEIKEKYGPDALAFIASSKCTNEESYLMQKLARAVIGTNNIDNCSPLLPDAGDDGAAADGQAGRGCRVDCRYRDGWMRGDRGIEHERKPPSAGDAGEAQPQAARAEADRERSAQARDGGAGRRLHAAEPWYGHGVAECCNEVHLRHGMGARGFHYPPGEQAGGVCRQPEYVHHGVCGAGYWNKCGYFARGSEGDCRGGWYVHPVGDGCDAALRWFGYVDRDQ